MDYEKAFYTILIINCLFLLLLALVSFRFLTGQFRKTHQVEAEIMAQEEVSLEVEQFLDLVEQLKER
jgi:hypothetical protein